MAAVPNRTLVGLNLVMISKISNLRSLSVSLGLLVMAGMMACSTPPTETSRTKSPAPRGESPHPVTIPVPQGRLTTQVVSADGTTSAIECASCHSQRTPQRTTQLPDGAFHAVVLKHGPLSCQSCHSAPNYEGFALADGQQIPRAQVMRLCQQCHGTQMRDFEAGLHGGMRGSWDLRYGPRERNACTACHDPHAPQFKRFIPTLVGRTMHHQGDGR
ncbi:MAG: hypothetical protein ACI9OJ_002352 [Myxococcota bacterium]|jgi:hypothetical protein